jgi:hypothetical protein
MRRFSASVTLAAALLVLAGAASAQRQPTPVGSLDDWRSWPVASIFSQHPVRGGFLDPRPGAGGRGVYHTGVDISVRDDRPEKGHPLNRTHRVYAIQGGTVSIPSDEASRSCIGRIVRVGHFTYSHVDPIGTVQAGDRIWPGQMIGWTCYHHWHLHLSETRTVNGLQVYVNPLRPGGRLGPYRDTAPPIIHAIRFTSPADANWEVQDGAVFSFSPTATMQSSSLHDVVDAEAWVGDPQSYTGWMDGRLKLLRTEISPYQVKFVLRRHLGPPLRSRVVVRADQLAPDTPLFGQSYAPGTKQSLPVYDCRTEQPVACAGRYWYHLGFSASNPYWDTTQLANGGYELCVTAKDIAGNRTSKCVPIGVRNPAPTTP